MSNPVIKVENLSKQYRLGEVGTGTISHDLNRWWHKIRGKEDPYLRIGESNDRSKKGDSEYVWALQDINFEVQQGEVLGIIGKNGAGKSTLLKILSKVTAPTTGSIKAKGRIAALLEVGTGFHPELTGRENIYLNGTILGMTKREVTAKLDEIVDFSGVERYLDTPVKRYSSGMMVRLGFAVAAHLEPEILIVDEVLAVGDAEYQKKAVGKMQEVSKEEGRTVLFVSHNIVVINQLCNKSLLLSNGNKVGFGATDQIVAQYINYRTEKYGFINKGTDLFFTGFTCNNPIKEMLVSGDPCVFTLKVFSKYSKRRVHVAVGVNDRLDNRIFTLYTKFTDGTVELKSGENEVICSVDNIYLKPGVYNLHLNLSDGIQRFDYISEGISIEIAPNSYYKFSMPEDVHGHILVSQKWYLNE
jgi:lipopolysaccharide transport system ATP-binding protein